MIWHAFYAFYAFPPLFQAHLGFHLANSSATVTATPPAEQPQMRAASGIPGAFVRPTAEPHWNANRVTMEGRRKLGPP